MNIYLANPRGFCAGVDRAIEIVESALKIFSPPIYVRHEVVHNRYVVNNLIKKGALFVEELDEIPDGATVIFSAHGVSQKVRNEAQKRDLRIFDATCPLVTKIHLEVARHERNAENVILIGHADVETLQVKNPGALAYVTQTTLSVDDTKNIIDKLKIKFPDINGPRKDDICYATQNRQDAVRELADKVDVFLVIGSINSSNSNRLRELAEKQNIAAYLIDGVEDINYDWFNKAQSIGITAGASAPEILVQAVITTLEKLFETTIITNKKAIENVHFQLPKELRS
jgi:4-hydroxy-3-methylbut-2-enyl diphosphate reductase